MPNPNMASPLSGGPASTTSLRLTNWESHVGSMPVDYHLHTTWTDGTAPAADMAVAAAEAGIREILFSEHVRHASTYFPEFATAIRSLSIPNLTCRVGAEAKVLDFEGTLDCSAETASLCDAIVGSVHSPPGSRKRWADYEATEAIELEFRLAMSIVRHSRAHILGHPMGMVITRFGVNPVEQLEILARACRESGTAFELNSRYCIDPEKWIAIVQAEACPVSVGSDAHRPDQLGNSWKVFMQRTVSPC